MVSIRQPEWLEAYVAACNAHAAAAAVVMMSPDIHMADIAVGGDFTGHAAVQQVLEGMEQQLSGDFRFTVKTVIDIGDTYAFGRVLSGTHDRAKPAMGLPAHRPSLRGTRPDHRRQGR